MPSEHCLKEASEVEANSLATGFSAMVIRRTSRAFGYMLLHIVALVDVDAGLVPDDHVVGSRPRTCTSVAGRGRLVAPL